MKLKYKDNVYDDREDSWLLQEIIKKLDLRNKRIIDIGTGTGIQAITAAKLGAKVIATDINPIACLLAKENSKINNTKVNIFCSDLFKSIKPNTKFDYIFFNAPYLPVEKPVDITWSGGKKIIDEFLTQAKQHADKDTRIIFVFSSLTKLNIKEIKILASKKFMKEEIFIGELCRD